MTIRSVISLLMACCLCLTSGCSWLNSALGGNAPTDAKAEVDWSFAREAIWLELDSASDLNFSAGQPHTLVLGVFQTTDQKVFVDMLADAKGVAKALITGQTAKGVLHLDRFVVSPDKKVTLKLDRVQEGRFVGVVAGYYDFDPIASSRYFRIPLNMESSGFVTKTYKAEPDVLAFKLNLGSRSIVNAQMLTFDAEKKIVLETVPFTAPATEIALKDGTVQQAKDRANAAMKLTD